MKSAKDLLDSLMGPSRNLSAKNRTGEDFKEPNVCKHFLVGFCPTSVLGKKVEHVPPCKLLHSLALKEELDKHPDSAKYRKEYEDAYLRKLEEIVADADARAAKEKRKARPHEIVTKLPEHLKIKVQVYEEARRDRLREAEEKGRAGDVEGSQMAMRSAEQALKDINGINKAHTNEFPGEGVCEACGVRYLNGGKEVTGFERLRDGDIWEDDHYASKAHEGYVQIREKLAEMRKAKREQEHPDKGSTDRKRSRSRGREKSDRDGRDGDRDRDRGRDRDRDRKGGGGERDRDGDRDRRNRDKDRDRDRR
eukprot:CAMPEP_0115634216 /NCGR_PEP_ID=MMETSP0272-20121206/32469_1 /TAXON_ID=71861 /ORGANISM="Scrippsiella trochoidea, Strain CCMP3099" /LENGTH=307 /DNA_ID=CAMNT_0003071043 /DNA_START=80 /DNA_END=999 /DNA_ORIENTATION=-